MNKIWWAWGLQEEDHVNKLEKELMGMPKVTLWYQHEPGEYGCDPTYNHLEHGWNTQEKPTVISQQQHWWNNRIWSKKLAYLENGLVTID